MSLSIRRNVFTTSAEGTCLCLSQRLCAYDNPYPIVDIPSFMVSFVSENLTASEKMSPEDTVELLLDHLRPLLVFVHEPDENGSRTVELQFGQFRLDCETVHVPAGASLHDTVIDCLRLDDFCLDFDGDLPLIGPGASCPDILPVPEMATA